MRILNIKGFDEIMNEPASDSSDYIETSSEESESDESESREDDSYSSSSSEENDDDESVKHKTEMFPKQKKLLLPLIDTPEDVGDIEESDYSDSDSDEKKKLVILEPKLSEPKEDNGSESDTADEGQEDDASESASKEEREENLSSKNIDEKQDAMVSSAKQIQATKKSHLSSNVKASREAESDSLPKKYYEAKPNDKEVVPKPISPVKRPADDTSTKHETRTSKRIKKKKNSTPSGPVDIQENLMVKKLANNEDLESKPETGKDSFSEDGARKETNRMGSESVPKKLYSKVKKIFLSLVDTQKDGDKKSKTEGKEDDVSNLSDPAIANGKKSEKKKADDNESESNSEQGAEKCSSKNMDKKQKAALMASSKLIEMTGKPDPSSNTSTSHEAELDSLPRRHYKTKPNHMQIVPKSTTPAKRLLENDSTGHETRVSKRSVRNLEVSMEMAYTANCDRKSSWRVWSGNDEIKMLKHMIKYKAQHKTNPITDLQAFRDSSDVVFSFQPSSTQLRGKIRKLKENYRKNVNNHLKIQNMTPHELKLFELSREVWGEAASELGNDNEIVTKAQPQCTWSCENIDGVDFMVKNTLSKAFNLIQDPLSSKSEKQWKELQLKECELHMKKLDLVKSIVSQKIEALRASLSVEYEAE